MADGSADINRCPPGGAEGISRLAALTGRPAAGLDAARGHEGPRMLAVIDEAWCIGCTLCIKACPVDCIIGAPRRMHHIIDDDCTGCELCIPACPVDCIVLRPVTGDRTGWQAWSPAQAVAARSRYAFHRFRVLREAEDNDRRLAAKAQSKLDDLRLHSTITDPDVLAAKRAVIEAAMRRARDRQAAPVRDAQVKDASSGPSRGNSANDEP
jgi:electron transport complex protein RnfB